MKVNDELSDNADVVGQVLAAVGRRDLDALMGLCHHDVVVREPRSLPHGGEHRGLDQVRDAAVRRAGTWAPYRLHDDEASEPELFASSDDHVVARWQLRASDAAGERVDVEAIDIYLLRDGRIVELETYYRDTASMVRFLERAGRRG
jgi:ketosteroid isomerase-like protein